MLKVISFCIALSCVQAMPKEREVIVLPSKFFEKVQNNIKKCEAETNPPPETFQNMMKGYVENDAALDFMYCYLLDTEFIIKDGHFNVARMVGLLKDESLKEKSKIVFEDCNKKSGENNLATFRLMVECYRDNSPMYFSM